MTVAPRWTHKLQITYFGGLEKEPPYQFIGVNWDYDGHGHIKIKSEKNQKPEFTSYTDPGMVQLHCMDLVKYTCLTLWQSGCTPNRHLIPGVGTKHWQTEGSLPVLKDSTPLRPVLLMQRIGSFPFSGLEPSASCSQTLVQPSPVARLQRFAVWCHLSSSSNSSSRHWAASFLPIRLCLSPALKPLELDSCPLSFVFIPQKASMHVGT